MSSEFTREEAMKFLPAKHSWISSGENLSKSISSIQRIFVDLAAYREVQAKEIHCSLRMQKCRIELNLLVAATTKGFISQIIDSFISTLGGYAWYDSIVILWASPWKLELFFLLSRRSKLNNIQLHTLLSCLYFASVVFLLAMFPILPYPPRSETLG